MTVELPTASVGKSTLARPSGAVSLLDHLPYGCEHTFVPREATILHADADCFFASVAQRDDPRLRGKPVIVGGGVVMAASYEARAYGIRSAMGGAQARRLCPDAIVVDVDWPAYVEASKALFEIFEHIAPHVEGLSMEEAFMDVSGLRHISGSPVEIGISLRQQVRDRVGLPITVGIATTKHVAKVASGIAKPDGLLLVPAGRELNFLHPLSVERLWGVGPATAEKLHRHGIARVRQLAELSRTDLVSMLGRASGRHVHALAHNRDPRRVRARRRRRSIGSQSALGRSSKTPEMLDRVAVAIVDRVTRRMRSAGRRGRTVTLRLRFDDFSRATRSRTLWQATASTQVVLRIVRALLAAATPTIERRGLTLLGVTISNLDNGGGAIQLELPLDGADRVALDHALDELRRRFGPTAVTRATLVGRSDRLAPSLLPGDEPDAPR
jgi:DNA polymerase-4